MRGGGSYLTASASEQEAPASELPIGSAINDDNASEATPEASAQSASTHAASGSAGGTTVSIQVYRSSFPIVEWNLNDDDFALTEAEWAWADRTSELPQDGTPGAAIEWSAPTGYVEPMRSGFAFAGWSTDKSAPAGGFLSMSPSINMPEGAPESGEYTLYALWTPLEYSVVFELALNPGAGNGPGSDESYALNWSSEDGVRTVASLGKGRYLVEGFTMAGADYDPERRTIALPEPARTGYRFLGWAEADDASSLVVDGPDGTFELNPVRLPQIDGTPVLTARWTSAFGVTAPLSITFGDYDKIGAADNPSMGEEDVRVADDTTQSEADDTATPGLTDQERYEALGQAYFENTGWNDPIKMVAITSERTANARDVLTTYDSKKATEAAVLGDGTLTNPGERLLSLYPSATEPSDKTTGVHFRLSDNLLEDDLAVLPSLDPGEKQPVTYGLNLANDPVTGAENHGLVLDTNDYERKQIATVSYTFAVGEADTEEPLTDPLYIRYQGRTYGLDDIKAAATHLAANAGKDLSNDATYQLYHSFLLSGMDPDDPSDPHGYIRWGDGLTYNVRIVGINQNTEFLYDPDNKLGSHPGSSFMIKGPAGLTFQFVDALSDSYQMNPAVNGTSYAYVSGSSNNKNLYGWGKSLLGAWMTVGKSTSFVGSNSLFVDDDRIYNNVPEGLREKLVYIERAYLNKQTESQATPTLYTTFSHVWIPHYYEVTTSSNRNSAFSALSAEDRRSAGTLEWYAHALSSGADPSYVYSHRRRTADGLGDSVAWWLSSIDPRGATSFLAVSAAGSPGTSTQASMPLGVVPCFSL